MGQPGYDSSMLFPGRLPVLPPVKELAAAARFACGLPFFLRRQIDVEQARATVRRRLAQRESDFLRLARQAIYGNPGSAYRRLLERAGCKYEDLERVVGSEGLEGALRTLLRQGVYLTSEEIKGRYQVVRGSATIALTPASLRNPRSTGCLLGYTSGSGGSRSPVLIDLEYMNDRAVTKQAALAGRGGLEWLQAYYGVPGAGVLHALEYGAGSFTRWFSPIDPSAADLDSRYRWSARLLRWAGLFAGISLPRPEHVQPDRSVSVARWMADVLRFGRTPSLWAYTSFALRVCQAAAEAGISLSGAQFTLGGEPTTSARLDLIRRAGAEAVSTYGSIESGAIGYGCLSSAEPDEVHFFSDLHALIQPAPGDSHGLPANALLISTLRPTAPLVLLNVSLGDQAAISERSCGCPLEGCGWTTHLDTVRSFEKLTAGGMTFLDVDVVRVLEETLPARFGGGPADYQLIEEHDAEGASRLRLLVHPTVGPLDAEAVADAFLSALGPGLGAQRVMAEQWRQLDLLRVERDPPLAEASGKILHMHQQRSAAAG
jgi:hypothetical protein